MTSSTASTADSVTPQVVPPEAVGLVGVGNMGCDMLTSLLKAGYRVLAYDPAPAARQRIVDLGGEFIDDPAKLAASVRMIVMSLPASRHVMTAITSLVPGLSAGQIVVDTSTVDPETTRQAAAMASAKGASYLDAPVLGRPGGAGRWILPVGGSAEAAAKARPVLLAFAKDAVWVGGEGSGNVIKLLNQLMFTVINCVSSEVMSLVELCGVDRKVFYDVVAGSGAATVSPLFKDTAKRMAEDHFDDPTFTVELLCKDGSLAVQMAERAGVRPRLAGLAHDLTEKAKASGLGSLDTSALYTMFRDEIQANRTHTTTTEGSAP